MARYFQRFFETGRIDASLWKNHFPTLLPPQVPACDDCMELKDLTCEVAGTRWSVSSAKHLQMSRVGNTGRRSGIPCSALVQKGRTFTKRPSRRISRKCKGRPVFSPPWHPGVLAGSCFLIYRGISGTPGFFSLSGRLQQIGKREYLVIG
jgi:hypothetical protein